MQRTISDRKYVRVKRRNEANLSSNFYVTCFIVAWTLSNFTDFHEVRDRKSLNIIAVARLRLVNAIEKCVTLMSAIVADVGAAIVFLCCCIFGKH
ncbi:MAG: hypothetical protein RMX68_006085 [Aulosira sp. ZfuVER01]|nr:hypothetical protein [Aulosira sp. ZfuVER01]MDZ8001493.1 hypothetical protein [Aulosira sp. DedVER01a]MDZ8051639.1 hypothetical protein [Aulosira sp. ZfuCHP01]